MGENLPGCSYFDADLGVSRASGGRSYVRAWDLNNLARALGRNFGLQYSDARRCVDAFLTGTCTTEPQGDWYDPMGGNNSNAVGSLSTPQAAMLGVLPAAQRITVASTANTSGTVTLRPLSGRTGVLALELVNPSLRTSYWLELRTATGRDAGWAARTRTHSSPASCCAAPVPKTEGTLIEPVRVVRRSRLGAEPAGRDARRSGAEPEQQLQRARPADDPEHGHAVRISTVVGSYGGDGLCAGFLRPSAPMSGVALFGGTEDLTVGGAQDLTAAVVGTDRAVWLRPVTSPAAAGVPWGAVRAGGRHDPDDQLRVRSRHRPGSLLPVGRRRDLVALDKLLGGVLSSSPAAAADGEAVRVFGRGGDGSLWGGTTAGSGARGSRRGSARRTADRNRGSGAGVPRRSRGCARNRRAPLGAGLGVGLSRGHLPGAGRVYLLSTGGAIGAWPMSAWVSTSTATRRRAC